MMRLLPLVAACLLLAAACGSTSRHGSVAPAVATRLASESDAVAAAVQAGDGCGAATLAHRLQQDVRTLAPALQASADAIAAEIVCVPAPPRQPQPAGPRDHPKPHKHGKDKGKGD
jgi:hypothetical protein